MVVIYIKYSSHQLTPDSDFHQIKLKDIVPNLNHMYSYLGVNNLIDREMFEQKYIIMETIGKNSQKMTSIVKDKSNQYYIAKKVPINDQRTMHEISLMRGLSHPNVIALHELIEEDNWAYIIEEYCEQGDLEYHLKRQLKMKRLIPEEVIARWMLQIILAIQYLHHLKIIHRDIRPKNIFLTANGNIKLGSFKASKVLEAEVSYAQTFLNSPYYMTPELMEGKAYDCKVDIWAFGCVLFEVCSLRPSFKKSNLVDLLNKVGKGKVQEIPPNYSKQLNLVYLKCMKRNPNERISARDLLKTNYFLQVIEKFISDKGLNLTEKIPIKKYNIHHSKYERIKIKKGLIKEKGAFEKKENLLPKIEIQSNKIERKIYSREKSKEKKDMVQTPVLKKNAYSKEKYEKSISTEKKRTYNHVKRSSEKTEISEINLENQKKTSRVLVRQKEKKCMMPPPMLPKPKKVEKHERTQTSMTSGARTATKGSQQQCSDFQMTRSKEQLSKQLVNIHKKELADINAGLNKIFQTLNIQEDEQEIEFDFVDENELRLTHKSGNEQQALLKTCKSKLEQLIQQINYKYCPDMQPISEKTTEFDSSSFSKIQLSFNH